MLKNRAGSSNIGCLFVIAIVACGFYAGYKFAVVQWNVESFKEELTQVVRFWSIEKQVTDPGMIKADVIRRAEKCGFDIAEEDISVQTEGVHVTITVSWQEPIQFPGGYVYKRDITISRQMRKFGR